VRDLGNDGDRWRGGWRGWSDGHFNRARDRLDRFGFAGCVGSRNRHALPARRLFEKRERKLSGLVIHIAHVALQVDALFLQLLDQILAGHP
jgi:hypothetical protein